MNTEAVEVLDQDHDIVTLQQGVVGAIVKSEVEAQLDAAHKYRRSVKAFLSEATTLATMTQEIAESCIYTLPRSDKPISGPSVRLAEICASAYGNLHVGARVVGIEDKEIVAQGVAWDLEKNLRATIEVRRRITSKNGRRYNDDMITVTGNAAASIGLRNAIFRVIPRAYVDQVYQRAREVAVGNASTLSAKRATVVERLLKMGILQDRLLKRVDRASVEDIALSDLETLIGLGTAIKNGDTTVDEAFPAVTATDGTKGVVDMNSLRAGSEENRGHGNENLDKTVGQTQTIKPAAEKQAAAPAPAAASADESANEKITEKQYTELLRAAKKNHVTDIQLAQYAEKLGGSAVLTNIRRHNYDKVLAFANSGGQEPEATDGN